MSGSAGSISEDDLPRLLMVARDLVDFERNILEDPQVGSRGLAFVQANPELILSRIISHLMKLFDVKTIDGVLPRVNEVYIQQAECKNGLNVLRSVLGLGEGTVFAVLTCAFLPLRERRALWFVDADDPKTEVQHFWRAPTGSGK